MNFDNYYAIAIRENCKVFYIQRRKVEKWKSGKVKKFG